MKNENTEEKQVDENEKVLSPNEEIDSEVDTFSEPESELVFKNRIETLENRVKILQADLVNYRRRKDEELTKKLEYAKEDIILDLLPICDNFERALALDKGDNPAIEKFLDGFEILYAQMKEVLKKYEVEETPALGEVFDENVHAAVLVGEDKEKDDGVILEVFTKGYHLKDRVIRHASVKVNKINK